MEYAHYWQKGTTPPDLWALIVADTDALLRAYSGPVFYLQANQDWIFFVGGQAQAFELQRRATRTHEGKPAVAGCSTARQPYDLIVCAILAAAADRCPAFYVKTHAAAGPDPEPAWAATLEWASTVLARPILKPLERRNPPPVADHG